MPICSITYYGKIGRRLFGKLSGKIGNVVVSSWKGIPYIRSKPSRNTSNTPAQQNQQSKFKLVIDFVNSIKPVINVGFKWNTERRTEMNSATSFIMKRAVRGEHPNLQIHYPSVLRKEEQLELTLP
ncbi:MAG TPA: DUF6266 family protein [Fodinibius sp.]|nr:DUF6266 family protein [Fodinibius sp.]